MLFERTLQFEPTATKKYTSPSPTYEREIGKLKGDLEASLLPSSLQWNQRTNSDRSILPSTRYVSRAGTMLHIHTAYSLSHSLISCSASFWETPRQTCDYPTWDGIRRWWLLHGIFMRFVSRTGTRLVT